MAIVPLERVTFAGPVEKQSAVIQSLQKLGCLHLVDLSQQETQHSTPGGAVSAESRDALKYLRNSPYLRRQAQTDREFSMDQVVDEVLEIKRETKELEDERDYLATAIAQTEPWGEFQLPSEQQLSGLRFWFLLVPAYQLSELHGETYQEIRRDQQQVYVVVLSQDSPSHLPGEFVHLDPRALSVLRHRAEEVEAEIEELQLRRIWLTRWCARMELNMARSDDSLARKLALQSCWREGEFFLLQGWAPRDKREQLQQFAQQEALAILVEPPKRDENPPTLLKNPKILAGGENAVTFYITPSYWLWDPSITVFFSFALFFAIIISDAGYGALLAGLLLWTWKSLSGSEDRRKIRNLILALTGCSLIYGVFAGSYFGITPPADSWFGWLHVIDATNQTQMMTASIAIGIVHLVWANLVSAWRSRHTPAWPSYLGWIAALLGGFAWGLALTEAVPEKWIGHLNLWGEVGLFVGLGLVLFFSSQRPLLSLRWQDWLARMLDGLMGLTRVSSAFGDTLSYLRLFALGLASVKLAVTFNNLASDAAANLAGFGVLVAAMILIIGHTLNFVLALMSGVVHGLRLNCIEFFNWSIPDEGYLFRPFEQKAKS